MKTRINLLRSREMLLGITILVILVLLSLLSPSFMTYTNIVNLLKSFTVLGIFSLGVLLVIISGGVDVSFTAIAQVVQYAVVYLFLNNMQGNVFLAFIFAIVLGTFMGLFNGYLIHRFKMPAIIITIATQNLFYGLMYVITEGQLIYVIPEYFWKISNTMLFKQIAANGAVSGISMTTAIWFFLSIIVALLLKFTVLGRSIYMIGGNPVAAQRIGVNSRNTTLFIYGAMGAVAGIGGIVHVSIVQTVIPNSIVGQELQVIAAVILGGASITGGKGSVLGTFLGVLLFAILSNSLTLLQISSYWYNVFTGMIILISVLLNAMQEIQQQKQKIRVQVENA
ncbi:ABC transporter permease [Pleomorphochaeta sp. DL1XJH-081]|uniref:ABC transporter permease n=1 Tax=Pleomorphochaeta sp. DL1XJH-081 TaxID=3409690 RepID=UPI003BB7EC99